jgi:hypothetical protein
MQQPQEGQQEQSQEQQDPMMQMIMQVDQGMQQIAQALGEQVPEAGQALGEVHAQYRKVVGAAVRQMQGGEQPQQASRMVDQHAQGKSQQQAY